MSNLTKHFTKAEMACQHCGVCLMRDTFMRKLQALRDAFGGPITVTSGYRCPDHNRAVGGAKDSQHVKGNAADIWAEDVERLEMQALMFFPNVVKGPGFIHVDDGPKRKPWSYK